MKKITSPDNPMIKLARKLQNKKYRDRERLFLVEGRRSVQEALARPELLHTIFLEESLAEEYADLQKVDTYLLQPKLLKDISSTETSQGIVAMLKMPDWSFEELLHDPGLIILLDRISDPGNLGSIIRSCWALGVSGLLLSPGCVDPFSPKVVRSSMGGILNLPMFAAITDQTLDVLQERGYEYICTGMEDAGDYYSVDLTGARVLVLGSEAQGVSEAIKSRCQRTIKIPMKIKVESLNVAAACAIIISEAWGQRNGRSVKR